MSQSERASGSANGPGRKAAFPAVGRISPDYYCMDGTIPRKGALDHSGLHRADGSQEVRLKCPNVFHAGDGNPHPLILFDANDPDQLERTEAFANEVLLKCIELGGTVTGEHGVGTEDQPDVRAVRRPWLAAFARSRSPSIDRAA